MKIRSLSTRVTLLLGAAVVVIIGAAALLMDHLVDAEMHQRFDDSLLSQARALAALTEVGPHGLSMDQVGGQTSRLLAGEGPTRYAIRCSAGEHLDSRPPPMAAPPHWSWQRDTQPHFADLSAGGVNQRAVWFRFMASEGDREDGDLNVVDTSPSRDCRMLVMQPVTQVDDILLVIDGILLLTPLLALLAVLAVAPMLTRKGLKPLVALGENMRAIGPHALGGRLSPAGTLELEPLVERFNEVLERMDEGVMRERRFADALAHETRTRLAELRTLVEVEQRYPSDRPLASLLQEIGGIGRELEGTVSGLLLLTRLDAGIESLDLRAVELGPLLEQQLERIGGTLHRRNLRIAMAPSSGAPSLVADHALLDIIAGNLLGNASAYAPAGDVIDIDWDRHSLRISNHAPDLDADEVARFGQRYWSKHHGTEGHAGLGLSLAGAAARAMGLSLAFTLDAGRRLHAVLRWMDRSVAT